MRIIYPTDFVRKDFRRTDEMPYRKKCFHDTDIYTFFLAFLRAENRNTRAENIAGNDTMAIWLIIIDCRNINAVFKDLVKDNMA